MDKNCILIKGAGDLASAVALRLYHAGYSIVMTEIDMPTAIRRTVAFAEAVYTKSCKVENVCGIHADMGNYKSFLEQKHIPILLNVNQDDIEKIRPRAVIDAIIAKKNLGTYRNEHYFTIALGPGFIAPTDVDVVIETMRGHSLGRCIYQGAALENTGIPGDVGGYTTQRVIRAEHNGIIHFSKAIGDYVIEKEVIGTIVTEQNNEPIYATISGIIRGLIQNNYPVHKGLKISDIDPRCELGHCYTVSDKGLALGGGVLEALLQQRILP